MIADDTPLSNRPVLEPHLNMFILYGFRCASEVILFLIEQNYDLLKLA